LFDYVERADVMMRGVLQEGTQRRQTSVAATGAVLAFLLEMIQEAQDQFGVEINQLQCGRRLANLGFGEG
jgi:hypothetical protein